MNSNLRLQELIQKRTNPTLLQILSKAAFIALVVFGAPAGVLVSFFPHFIFGIISKVVCLRGSTLGLDLWSYGGSTQVQVFCVDPVSGAAKDRNFISVPVLLGVFFLLVFYITFVVLLLHRAWKKKKYGSEE